MNAKLKGELSVATHEDRIVITQKRSYKGVSSARHYTVSLTREEAKRISEQLTKHVALLDELDRRGLA